MIGRNDTVTISFKLPSFVVLLEVIAGATVLCVLLFNASYPVEELSGVVFVWALAFSAVHFGMYACNELILKRVGRILEQILEVENVAEHLMSARLSPQVVVGFAISLISHLGVTIGVSIIAVGLLTAPLGFTPLTLDTVSAGKFVLVGGSVAWGIQSLLQLLFILAFNSLPDESRCEVVTRLRAEYQTGRQSGRVGNSSRGRIARLSRWFLRHVPIHRMLGKLGGLREMSVLLPRP